MAQARRHDSPQAPARPPVRRALWRRNATVASARVLKKYRDATWLIGDPGTGKGAMGCSIAHSLDAFPVLVSRPHLVEKHKRGIRHAGRRHQVVIAEARATCSPPTRYVPGQKLVVIVGIPASSLGPGVYRVRTMKNMHRAQARPGHKAADRVEEGRDGDLPHCGKPLDPKLARSSKRVVKCSNKKRQAPSTPTAPRPASTPNAGNARWTFAAWAGMHSPETLMEYETVDGRKRPNAPSPAKRAPISLEDYAPLPTGMSMKRWPLARHRPPHPKGFFRLYIADEAHQFKARAPTAAMPSS